MVAGIGIKEIVIVLAVLQIFYSIISNKNSKRYSDKLKKILIRLKLKLQYKVSTNKRVFLYHIAPKLLSIQGITPSSVKSDNTCCIPWLIEHKNELASFFLYELRAGGTDDKTENSFIITLYDYKNNLDKVNTLIDNLGLPEYTELLEDEKSISFVFESNASITSSYPEFVKKLLDIEVKLVADRSEATFGEKLDYYLASSRLVNITGLTLFALFWANIVFYAFSTQSLALNFRNASVILFSESQPILFYLAALLFVFLFYKTLSLLTESVRQEEYVASRKDLTYVVAGAITFLSINYVADIDLENRFYMEKIRLLEASDRQLVESSVGPSSSANFHEIALLSPKLLELLESKQYGLLEDHLDKLHQKTDVDINFETSLYQAYSSFSINKPILINEIKQWQLSNPSSLHAKLAEAFYFYGQGWATRGSKNIAKTEQATITKMKKLMSKSELLLNDIVQSPKYSLVASALLIAVRQVSGGNGSTKDAYLSAIERYPNSYLIRFRYLISLQPRWGGSYREMLSIINDSKLRAAQNEQLALLQAAIIEEAGDISVIHGDKQGAKEFYEYALKFGDNPYIRQKLGKIEYRLANYEMSLLHFNKAIELHANNHLFYHWRAWALVALKRYSEAESDQKVALILNPLSERYGYLSERLAQVVGHENYREYYGFSLDGSKLGWQAQSGSRDNVLYTQALKLIKSSQYKSAIKKIKQAVAINPHQIEYYLTLDMVLGQTKQWDEIIDYWNKFLVLYPKNARAHKEVSGTHYHNRNKQKFVYHLSKAAEYGDSDAIRRIKQMNGI